MEAPNSQDPAYINYEDIDVEASAAQPAEKAPAPQSAAEAPVADAFTPTMTKDMWKFLLTLQKNEAGDMKGKLISKYKMSKDMSSSIHMEYLVNYKELSAFFGFSLKDIK